MIIYRNVLIGSITAALVLVAIVVALSILYFDVERGEWCNNDKFKHDNAFNHTKL